MKPGGQNAKGGGFERDVCRKLTRWITGASRPEIFWRSATSGAKATVEANQGNESYMGGDIVAIDSRGMWFTEAFNLECKARKAFNLEHLFGIGGSTGGEVAKWWEQAVADAGRWTEPKLPLLICKKNRSPTFVAFGVYNHHIGMAARSGVPITARLRVTGHEVPFEVMLFDEFLALISASRLRFALNRRGR